MPLYVRKCRDCGAKFEIDCDREQLFDATCQCGSENHTHALTNPPMRLLPARCYGSDELHGTRRRLWDITINPDEVAEVRREFAGVPAHISDDGKVTLDSKTAKRAWYKREREIHDRAQEEHAKADEKKAKAV